MLKKCLLVVTMASLAACQKTDPQIQEKMDKLQARLDTIQRKVDTMGSAAAARAPRPAERTGPDPSAVYAVPVGDSAVKGPASAKVTIIEAAEFACPFCRLAENTMDEIAKAYPNEVRFVFKHYVVHPQTATIPALATCAAQQQGKFWEMKQAIWDSAWEVEPRPRMKDAKLLERENMEKLAADLKLNMNKFKADLDGQTCKDQLAKHQQELSRLGVDGTPAFYVNGRPISGAQPFQNFKMVIDEELKKANEAIKGGVKAEDYYEKAVVAKGKKNV